MCVEEERVDPTRAATLTVADDAYSPFWRHTIIGQILDIQERENASRGDFRPAISREMVERAADALFGIYDCRSTDFAAAYEWISFWTVLGVDWRKLTYLPRDSDANPPPPISGNGDHNDD